MSEFQAKLIRMISVIGGFLGAGICVILASTAIKTEKVTAILLLLLAIVFLVLIYPLYQLGKSLGNHAASGSSSKNMNGETDTDPYSPLNKHPAKTKRPPDIAQEAEMSIPLPATAHAPRPSVKKPTGDLTREFGTKRHHNEQTGEITITPTRPSTTSMDIPRP